MVLIIDNSTEKVRNISKILGSTKYSPEEIVHYESGEKFLNNPNCEKELASADFILLDHNLIDDGEKSEAKMNGAMIYEWITHRQPEVTQKIFGISNEIQPYLHENYLGAANFVKLTTIARQFKDKGTVLPIK